MALPARIPANTAEHRCSWQRKKNKINLTKFN
jgi:hypothetical protein